jgi:methylenetetrahydrofolate--tRNA-(uracil-5-)-methyltransferase
MAPRIIVVGGGLAGSEAAWQAATAGLEVDLVEMRPLRSTPAHQTGDLAELVCSNSLRGNDLDQAAGLLKEEMRRLRSLLLAVADEVRVPAGSALAVDRELFARRVTERISSHPRIRLVRREVEQIPEGLAILATGPLTSDTLATEIAAFVGAPHLHFYDAISPVITADSINQARTFRAGRYGKGGADYLNCPLDSEQYRTFHEALATAGCARLHEFDREVFFEGCLPVEVIARRGPGTLLFGPMRPVGLVDPRTGRRPHAVVQLRQDNLAASHFSLVGFQTQIAWPEQRRVFRLIPGLEGAEFVRYGMVHRNTYVCAPLVLARTFETRQRQGLFLAGQMSGVEGYIESAASGLIAGLGAAFRAAGREPVPFPEETALGALARHVADGDPRGYQPTNVAFGLLPDPPERVRDKTRRRRAQADRALHALERFSRESLAGEPLGRPLAPAALSRPG